MDTTGDAADRAIDDAGQLLEPDDDTAAGRDMAAADPTEGDDDDPGLPPEGDDPMGGAAPTG